MCEKCQSNESEKFKDRGKWKTDILEEIIDRVKPLFENGGLSYAEAYNEIKLGFRKRIDKLRKKRRKEYSRKYFKKRYNNPQIREVIKQRRKRWEQ